MRVLITGGCGFVGRHFTKRFVEKGAEVLCVDNFSSQSSLLLEEWPSHLKCNFELIKQDCRTYFNENVYESFDIVMHLAAVVGGRAVIENSPLEVADDLSIDAEFFKWASKSKPHKIVYFSSSAAYPVNLQEDVGHKLVESDLDLKCLSGVPDLSYGWAKLTGEFLAKLAHEKYGLNVVCYRPFSGYGEDQHDSYPFMAILKRILKKENPIELWSDAVRDFVYIEDIVDCVMMTMNQIENGSAVNIASGNATSFSDLVNQMLDITGHTAEIKLLEDKPKGVNYRVGDSTYVNSLGWTPKRSFSNTIPICAALLL